MASSRFHSRYGDRWPDHTYTSSALGKRNLEHLRNAHRRLQSWYERWNCAAHRTKHGLYIGELPDSPGSSVLVPSNETDSDDFDCGALMDRNDQRTSPSNATQSWSCGPRSQMPNQSWQGHWRYDGWDIHKTYGTPIREPQFEGANRFPYRQQMKVPVARTAMDKDWDKWRMSA